MKSLKKHNWRAIAVGLTVTVLAWGSWSYLATKTNQAHLQRELESRQQTLDIKLKELEKSKLDNKQLEDARKSIETQKQELEKQLQARRSTSVVSAQAPQPTTPKPAPASPNCGSDPYMAYIYQKESGCRVNAINPIGCYGIGQSCPRSKIAHCGDDWACQNAWFTNYAVQRYGSTQQAYNFWLANHWW